jgi:hypothetical protein
MITFARDQPVIAACSKHRGKEDDQAKTVDFQSGEEISRRKRDEKAGL